jgi:hypothetical protein
LVCAEYKKNGAIQKDLIADNEWSPYKCRCDIFVEWAPLSSLLLACLFCGRHRTEKEQISILPYRPNREDDINGGRRDGADCLSSAAAARGDGEGEGGRAVVVAL